MRLEGSGELKTVILFTDSHTIGVTCHQNYYFIFCDTFLEMQEMNGF